MHHTQARWRHWRGPLQGARLHAEALPQEGRFHLLPVDAERREARERLVLLVVVDEVGRAPPPAGVSRRRHTTYNMRAGACARLGEDKVWTSTYRPTCTTACQPASSRCLLAHHARPRVKQLLQLLEVSGERARLDHGHGNDVADTFRVLVLPRAAAAPLSATSQGLRLRTTCPSYHSWSCNPAPVSLLFHTLLASAAALPQYLKALQTGFRQEPFHLVLPHLRCTTRARHSG